MREAVDTPDARVSQIASRQHGVVGYRQLTEAGIDKSAILRRVGAGRLHRLFRGVYAVGHRGLSNHGRWMAAVMACGEGAALSHRSAAEHWGMLRVVAGPVHVSVPRTTGLTRRTGLVVHRSASLPRQATTIRQGVAVTTAARTISDLKRTSAPEEVRVALRRAVFARLPIGEHAGSFDGTESELERRFLALCRRGRLPEPEVNAWVDRFKVDFLWRAQRVIVETDGYRAHAGSQAFEDDHTRDNELMALDYEVLRFTYARVMEAPAEVIALVRRKLRR